MELRQKKQSQAWKALSGCWVESFCGQGLIWKSTFNVACEQSLMLVGDIYYAYNIWNLLNKNTLEINRINMNIITLETNKR